MFHRLKRAGRTYIDSVLSGLQASSLIPVQVRPFLLRMMGASIGERCYIYPGVRFHRWNLSVGRRSIISTNCFLDSSGSIEIGDRVSLSPGCRIHSATHRVMPSVFRRDFPQVDLLVTKIQRGCWLGSGVTVLAGVTVAEGCVIAAGAVVTKDCSANGLYGGVPAKRIKDLEVTTDLPFHYGAPVDICF